MVAFIFILMVYGLCDLLVFGLGPYDILKKNREFWEKHNPKFLGGMLNCMMCLSFNLGLILSIISLVCSPVPFTPFTLILGHNLWLIQPFLDASLASGGVWFLHTLQEYLERK